MEVDRMNRRHIYILLIALGVLSLVVGGLLLGWNVDPVPPELVGRWRLVNYVVDTQVHPPHSDHYTVGITSVLPEKAPRMVGKYRSGYMAWSDGCNTHWATFRATRAGKIRFTGKGAMTLKECVSVDTGATYGYDEGILLWADDAVAYELRDGQLWLYTSRDKKNALVLE
jgi:hypothetical protein